MHAIALRPQNPLISARCHSLPPAGGGIVRSDCTSRPRCVPIAGKLPANSTVRMHDERLTWDFLSGVRKGCFGRCPARLQNGQPQFKQDGGCWHPLPVARHGAHELHGIFAALTLRTDCRRAQRRGGFRHLQNVADLPKLLHCGRAQIAVMPHPREALRQHVQTQVFTVLIASKQRKS